MRPLQYLACGFVASSTIQAASLPEHNALNLLAQHGGSSPRSENIVAPENTLAKRKGGGGGGKGGGSSGGGGKSSGGNTGSPGGRTSPTSNAGGSTKAGSGAPRTFGGGGYYGGGATTPYAAGTKTPKGLVAGAVLAPAALLIIFPGLWLYSAYPYHYSNPYRFYNQTYRNGTEQGQNQSLPVTCYCQERFSCGCDENDDSRYLNEIVGNGSYDALNKTLANVADVDGKRTLLLNGTLPNGTTAPGGFDDAGINLKVGKWAGYWVIGVIVLSTVTML